MLCATNTWKLLEIVVLIRFFFGHRHHRVWFEPDSTIIWNWYNTYCVSDIFHSKEEFDDDVIYLIDGDHHVCVAFVIDYCSQSGWIRTIAIWNHRSYFCEEIWTSCFSPSTCFNWTPRSHLHTRKYYPWSKIFVFMLHGYPGVKLPRTPQSWYPWQQGNYFIWLYVWIVWIWVSMIAWWINECL